MGTGPLRIFNSAIETHDDVLRLRQATLRESEQGSLSPTLCWALLPELDRISTFIERAGVRSPERAFAACLSPPESLLRFATGIQTPLAPEQLDTLEESIALEHRLGVRVPSRLARLTRRYLGLGDVQVRRRAPAKHGPVSRRL